MGKERDQHMLISRNRVIFYMLATLIASFYTIARFSFLNQNSAATLELLTEGTAATPFQYRDLIPRIVDTLTTITDLLGHQVSHIYFYVAIEVVIAFLLILALQYYLSLLIERQRSSYLLSLTLFLLLTFNYVLPRNYPYYYPWDTPAVFFMLLGLVLLYQRKWGFYYIVFMLGTWNRETMCFLTFAYLFTVLGNEDIRTITFHVLLQFLLWLLIKVGLYGMYIDNVGAGLFERYHVGTQVSHLSSNLQVLAEPLHLITILSSFGFLWLFVVFRYSTIQNQFVRNSLKVFWPYCVGMLLVANINELRIWGELFPYVIPALALVWTQSETKRS